jgi:quinol monooxygenase YgiN
MKNLFLGIIILLGIAFSSGGLKNGASNTECDFNKDSMVVVALFKKSFDACKAEVLAKEPGCLDYSLFQSYHDSTLFCLTEAWATKGDHNAHMLLEHTKKHIAEIKGINDPTFKSKTNYTYWICPGANAK